MEHANGRMNGRAATNGRVPGASIDGALDPAGPSVERRPVSPFGGGAIGLARAFLAQWRCERLLRRRATRFRTTGEGAVRAAYDSMSPREFEAVNATQHWFNCWNIPRSLAGLIPQRPLLVVDLGCGTGGSTAVLAWRVPPGSRVIGFDLSPRLLEAARRRTYRHSSGSVAQVDFRCQSITSTLRYASGEPLASGSVDLAHASGVVGHHLDHKAASALAAELRRVVRADGAVVLDAGPRLDRRTLSRILAEHGFDRVRERGALPFNERVQIVFRPVRASAAKPRHAEAGAQLGRHQTTRGGARE